MGLKGYRKVAGLTQAELAAAIGSTQSHVSEYENGARRLLAAELVLARLRGEGGFPPRAHPITVAPHHRGSAHRSPSVHHCRTGLFHGAERMAWYPDAFAVDVDIGH